MRVDVLGKTLSLPQRCTCCGRTHSSDIPAAAGRNAGVKVLDSQAAAWRFPVCTQCLRHTTTWQSAARLASSIRFGGLGLAFVIVILGGFVALVLGVAMAFTLSALARHLRLREARRQCHPECAWAGPPVFYLGLSDDVVQSFEFAQLGYAADFMRLNLKKLIYLSSEALRLVQPDLDREAAQEAERQAIAHERMRIAAAEEAERKAIERERVRIAAEVAHDNNVYQKCIARIDTAKGPAGRRSAVEAGLRSLRQDHMRQQLMLEASRFEVSAAIAKAEGLKSSAAKLRTLSEALEAVRNDAVPDHLQVELIRSLETAIAKIEDEKNSIDMV
jgi:hypothetical protein